MDPWVGKISWRRQWLFTPVFLPGESHGQRSLAGYSPWGRTESDRTQVTDAGLFPLLREAAAVAPAVMAAAAMAAPAVMGAAAMAAPAVTVAAAAAPGPAGYVLLFC